MAPPTVGEYRYAIQKASKNLCDIHAADTQAAMTILKHLIRIVRAVRWGQLNNMNHYQFPEPLIQQNANRPIDFEKRVFKGCLDVYLNELKIMFGEGYQFQVIAHKIECALSSAVGAVELADDANQQL